MITHHVNSYRRKCREMSLRIRALILLGLVTPLTLADVYRCQEEDGTWQFTDRQCIEGAGQKVILPPLRTIEQQEPRGLSEAELEALTILDENMAASRTSGIKARKQKEKQIRKNKKVNQQNCVLAVRLLDEIGQKRSHGYRLSEATSLNQETRQLEGIRRTNCRQ
jgi:hypothetical protein